MFSSLGLVVVLLAVSVGIVIVFRRLHLPPLLGYLLAGIAIGPHAAGWIRASEETRYLAEFGVVFLMFSIGLEFSLPKLYTMRRLVFGLGSAQVVLTIAGGIVGSLFLGLDWRLGVALGGALAMSSTAIGIKMLAERLETDTPHGREVVGVLLFQDLAVVPLLIVLPALASGVEQLPVTLGLALIKAITVLGVLLFVGQKVMRSWFHIVARGRSHELFILNVLLITLGLALLTELAGLSLALGAFLAGMLISETEFRYQVEDDIKPFRDVLLGLFFVTIGMLLDMHVVIDRAGWVLLALIAPVLGKFGLVVVLSRIFGAAPGTAVRSALYLCTASEFGFVLLSHASNLKLMPDEWLQVVLAAMILSMMASPFLIKYSNQIALRLAPSEWFLRSLDLTRIAQQSVAVDRHVIICGYGKSGQYLARLLAQDGINYIALDLDPDRVREASAAGDTVVYGDAARREVLVSAGIGRAAAMVISYADTQSALKVLHHALALNPGLPIIVRTIDDTDLDVLTRAGAAEVVPEALEGSLMLASNTALLLGQPLNHVLRRIRELRRSRYGLMRGFFHGVSDQSEDLDHSQQPRLHSVILPDNAAALGRQVTTLALNEIGVEVSAIRRRNIRALEHYDDMDLQVGDVVVLLGLPEGLARAEKRLLQGGK